MSAPSVQDPLIKWRSMLFDVPTDLLALIISERKDLRKPDGLTVPNIYECRRKMGPIPSVDGIAVRKQNGIVEGGLIRRKTGKFRGKLCFVGGVVAYGESIEQAMRRHYRDDLGVEIDFLTSWETPVRMNQYCPRDEEGSLPEGFGEDASKHSYASTHLVTLRSDDVVCGSTDYGQEAEGFEWISRDNCPPEEDFAYSMRGPFLECLAEAERLME